MFSLGNKHAFGAHIGVTDNNQRLKDDTTDTYFSLSYYYYVNGINNKGWSFGITPLVAENHDSTLDNISLSVGYNF